jgi:hypothetical protein
VLPVVWQALLLLLRVVGQVVCRFCSRPAVFVSICVMHAHVCVLRVILRVLVRLGPRLVSQYASHHQFRAQSAQARDPNSLPCRRSASLPLQTNYPVKSCHVHQYLPCVLPSSSNRANYARSPSSTDYELCHCLDCTSVCLHLILIPLSSLTVLPRLVLLHQLSCPDHLKTLHLREPLKSFHFFCNFR